MPELINHIARQLDAMSTMREIAQEANLLAQIRAVQEWQSARMLLTHSDLLLQPRFSPAMHFFVEQLYGPQDFSQRDQDITRLVPKMAKYLPNRALSILGDALELNALCFELDFAMAGKLRGQQITRQSYATAYLNCANQTQRQQQITLLQTLGTNLAEAVATKGISTLLMLARRPAKKAGLLSLYQFLHQGHHVFKRLGKADDFILPIVQREQQLMINLFAPEQINLLPDVTRVSPDQES